MITLPPPSAGLRLNIGGRTGESGWLTVNVVEAQDIPGKDPLPIDIIGTCTNLSAMADGTAAVIYSSHVLEHLSFPHEVPLALAEFRRVLAPGGLLLLAVPNLAFTLHAFFDPNMSSEGRRELILELFGGQHYRHDYHKFIYDFQILADLLTGAGFQGITQHDSFGLFNDASEFRILGERTSLNLSAIRA